MANASDDKTLSKASSQTSFSSIGPYRLVEMVGAGGMGEVWRAEQTAPFHRTVALKLIKAGMDTREVVARFESERQALALMDHPTIAKVFDAGSTPQGRPYFVMEYVQGVPITLYCDKHRLTTEQRLELFIRVCEGVQHAHQKAILHRDLKPSNILVSEVDGKPVPRIIDFGVAKATAQRLTPGTLYTQLGSMVGTPAYMSPEQADSGGVDVDTRTDIYSLGVVLYELLVGALPLDFTKTPPDRFRTRLREEDVQRPSTRVRASADTSSTTAQARGTELPALLRELRGDLDAITLKCLEKDRARRYATPAELAADMGRYLRHEPVVARPAGLVYRTRKYARRHRIAVAVATGLVAVLAAFVVLQRVQLQRTRLERDRANRERDRATRITDFMTGMFNVSDPSEARGNTITAREILDKASKDIGAGLSKDPEAQAQMMQVMGNVYRDLGLYARAQPLLDRSVEIRRRVLGPDHPDTLLSMDDLGTDLDALGDYAEAEKLERETLEISRRVLGPEHPDTLKSMTNLAIVLSREGRNAEAEKLERETLEISRRVLGAEHPQTALSIYHLGVIAANRGNRTEALSLLRQALDHGLFPTDALGMEEDNDLKSLYSDPRFVALVAYAKERQPKHQN
jgi:serine/threonine protein kinase